MQKSVTRKPLPADHFLMLLDVPFHLDSGVVRASSLVRPALFAAGTSVIRSSLLLTMVDFMSGSVTGREAGPTLDMRLQVLRRPPTSGRIEIVVRPLRIGARIVVSEASLSDGHGVEFGRALTTFMNIPINGVAEHPRPAQMPEASFDEMVTARVRDDRTVEFTPGVRHLNNAGIGTVQGGVQSMLAELCAQHALGEGRPMVASDLDIRFLNPAHAGTLVATAEPLPSDSGQARCRVMITDDAGTRLSSCSTLTMVAAP